MNDDQALNDDFLKFRLDTRRVDYANFCRAILTKLIDIFRPDRVEVDSDNAVGMADWEITRVIANLLK